MKPIICGYENRKLVSWSIGGTQLVLQFGPL